MSHPYDIDEADRRLHADPEELAVRWLEERDRLHDHCPAEEIPGAVLTEERETC